MVTTYPRRPDAEFLAEQKYLEGRMAQIEKNLGKVAARQADAVVINQPLDALDRARELVGALARQVRVRRLEDAVQAQIAWLDAAEARLAQSDGEPKVGFNRIELDRRLLDDIRAGWVARRN
jgi:hypothetical protein